MAISVNGKTLRIETCKFATNDYGGAREEVNICVSCYREDMDEYFSSKGFLGMYDNPNYPVWADYRYECSLDGEPAFFVLIDEPKLANLTEEERGYHIAFGAFQVINDLPFYVSSAMTEKLFERIARLLFTVHHAYEQREEE